MTPRDIVLASVRNNLPQPTVPLPENTETDQKETTSGLGYKQHLTSLPEVQRLSHLGEPILAVHCNAGGVLNDLLFARLQMGLTLS